ncbi:MAG: LamG domain-containing protein [Pirellulaceae bacterium]
MNGYVSTHLRVIVLLGSAGIAGASLAVDPVTGPFQADSQTVLLYHFDDETGSVTKDSSGCGYDGDVRGPTWTSGRFRGGLHFDGIDDSVFRQFTPTMEGLRTLTVECWLQQERPGGRQFLVGRDVSFHFDFSEGSSTSLSLYNQGGAVPNTEGKPHIHLGTALGAVRCGRWHHIAATFDGQQLSFFCDGVLCSRQPGGRDFLLGVPSRGLWIGCYVGQDFWYSGTLDEVRVSNCVRYDAENKLQVGQAAFTLPTPPIRTRTVRAPRTTGSAQLHVRLKRLHGPAAHGTLALQAPGRPAALVGTFDLVNATEGDTTLITCDVSDELQVDGRYILGIEIADGGGYLAVTEAALTAGDSQLSFWSGEALSRHTFSPPILISLPVGEPSAVRTDRILLTPESLDRWSGAVEFLPATNESPGWLSGTGTAEYWLDIPAEQDYAVYLRYASISPLPCDLVVDGVDLHAYHMAARHSTGGATPLQAFWEYQGRIHLTAGLHWIRLEGILPEVVAMRLDPVPAQPAVCAAWHRDPVPDANCLSRLETWTANILCGQPHEPAATVTASADDTDLQYSVTFRNTNRQDLLAGDVVSLESSCAWDLEPFGRLAFRFEGHASGHVASLVLRDVQGNERLIWRHRDTNANGQDISVPILFEGNDVFDAGRVRQVCLVLDEGNTRVDEVNTFGGALRHLRWERRDELVPPDGYTRAIADARVSLTGTTGQEKPPALLIAPRFRPWTRPVVPEEHPRYAQSSPLPVTRATLGYELHCTGARSIDNASLDQFHKHYDFGDVCWPHIGICPQRGDFATDADHAAALQRMEEQLAVVRDRGLFLFDIWGYVPFDNSYPARIAPEHREILIRVFGDRFLGFDNGEQDGRYIGGFASNGRHTNRREGWDDFVRWDEIVCRDSQDYMNATGSLNFSHYYGERNCRTLGLETAQGLPSDTLMFSFLRGAGKEYGRLLTQATSVWNRFGYNMYHGRRTESPGGYGYGPNKGCSLSLHKRLFLSSYLGGHSIAGTETAQFTMDELPDGRPELSPLGRQHLELRDWFRQHPERGVMYAPVAIMLDFYHGWNMPRHLYRGDMYKIWGKFPYEKGDYAIDGLFRMIWPGYEDCSYLRNERGFLTPTPFGDIFDVVTNRCPADVLGQYTAVMLMGDVEMTPTLVENLTAFAQQGGDVLLTAEQARALPDSLHGLRFGNMRLGLLSHDTTSGQIWDEQPYSYRELTVRSAAPLLTNEACDPLLTVNPVDRGRVIVCAVDHWMTDRLTYRAPEIVHMHLPFRWLRGIGATLGRYFNSFSPITMNPPGLGVTCCCFADEPRRMLVGLFNNELFVHYEGTLQFRLGTPESVRSTMRERDLQPRNPLPIRVPAGDIEVLDVKW